MALVINGQIIPTTDRGFLINSCEWNETVAQAIAEQEKIELTENHWEILFFIRGYYQIYNHLPNTRMFVKAVRKTLGDGKGNSLYLHRLFPEGPLKYACKLAGLPKPPNCI
ncbi:MAG: TusE/DsrC/DsvC family sulfur relay protein [Methylococcaceae bacterium]